MTQAIPKGYHSVSPSFAFKDSQKAIDYYKKAFGAKLLDFFPNMDGKGIMHATLQIGDSILMLGDEMPGKSVSAETLGSSPIGMFLYVTDADRVYDQAIAAGGKVEMPMMDMFWGDRAGSLKDPFGYNWMIATHTKDMTKDEIRKNAEAFFAAFTKKQK